MNKKDKKAVKAMDVIRRYCEEHVECEGCKLDCVMLKQGVAPCFWVPGLIE